MQTTSLLRKGLAVGIILLFIGTAIIPSSGQKIEKSSLPASRGHWLYVGGSGPGNYTKIQDAINNANNGDTVFVYDDSSPYMENIVINKGICLLGENEGTTVIESFGYETIISITADNVTISHFTIRDGVCIAVSSSHHVDIVWNNITDTEIGVYGGWSSNISITNNIFYKNLHGSLSIESSRDLTVNDNYFLPDFNPPEKSPPRFDTMTLLNCNNYSIQGNNFTYNPFWNSLDCWSSDDSLISNNGFTGGYNTGFGITLWYGSKRNIICNNSIDNGISLDNANDNTIKYNHGNYGYGIDVSLQDSSNGNIILGNTMNSCLLSASNNNSIYHNNFMGGSTSDDGNNSWDHGYPSGGNYWENYHGVDNYSGVDQNELDPDGIGDTRYLRDHYPLMLPYGMTNLSVQFSLSHLRVSIVIKNGGSTTALNVQWIVTLKGGILFCKRAYQGIVKPILPGKEITVSPGFFLLGLGCIQITLSAWADNAPIKTGKIYGTLIIFYFFIR